MDLTAAPRRGPGRPSNRERVLDAAMAVALRDGPGAVTVDAVVTESGLSRGGVLYHFRSKDSLLAALVDRDIDAVRAVTGLDDAASTGDGTGASTGASTGAASRPAAERIRAYYDACTGWAAERGHVALAVALAENPALLGSWARVQRDLDAVDAASPDADATPALLARLALDGLWFSDLVDPDRFDTRQRARVVEAILALGEGTP